MQRIIIGLVLGLLLSGGLYLSRHAEAQRLGSELAKVQGEKLALQQKAIESADLARVFTGKTDVAAFTDALYGCARQTGLNDHEVTTSAFREEQSFRARGKKQASSLRASRLQISLSGDFRTVAEYLDLMQKLDSHKRVTRLTLTPGDKQLAAKIIIDLYALGEPHGR